MTMTIVIIFAVKSNR